MPKEIPQLKDLSIAYAPYSDNLLGPGDRRRFCFFAKELELNYSIYKSDRSYDVVILSSTSDLSQVRKIQKSGSKVIIDLVDSYLIKVNFIFY